MCVYAIETGHWAGQLGFQEGRPFVHKTPVSTHVILEKYKQISHMFLKKKQKEKTTLNF